MSEQSIPSSSQQSPTASPAPAGPAPAGPAPVGSAPAGAAPETSGGSYRIEKDSMGEVRVPALAKWRAQTQRAVQNFPISGQPIERELIAGLALIKGAGARVRAKRGLLEEAKADAIAAAAAEVVRGDWDAEFPIDVFQTGSG